MMKWKILQDDKKNIFLDKNILIIKNILNFILWENYNFYIFWSRARWDFRKNSDYDIWIKWKNWEKISFENLIKIKSEFENKPFLIDVVDLNNCKKEFLEVVNIDKIKI